MAMKFAEPGGDATFDVNTNSNGGFWNSIVGSPTAVTDFVYNNHLRSIKFGTSGNIVRTSSIIDNTGGRFSYRIYIVTLPTGNTRLAQFENSGGGGRITINLSSSGVLGFQIGGTPVGSGSTLSTGIWYRLSVAFTATSTTVNELRLYKDGVLDVSLSNQTLTGTDMIVCSFGNNSADSTFDHRTNDHYVDNDSSLTDTGDIWVTAKRPNANGTLNQFTTQIGSGGSGYGSGHSPQINERPLSITNGWSIVGSGSATIEEYGIESVSTGDLDLTGATIIDYMGWVYAKSSVSESGAIIVTGTNSPISLTSTNTMFTYVKGSSSYPIGTAVIGILTDTTIATVSLYECGIIVAFIPGTPVTGYQSFSFPTANILKSYKVIAY